MSRFSILNVIIYITLIISELLFHSLRDQISPTPDSDVEAFYNLFIKDNTLLLILFAYLIVSSAFFMLKTKKK
jgi:hypothetical protein